MKIKHLLLIPILIGCATTRTENTNSVRNDTIPLIVRPYAMDSVRHVACYSFNNFTESCMHLDSLNR